MELSNAIINDWEQHTLQQYPLESCGVLVNDTYVACRNIHEDAAHAFQISPRDIIKAEKVGKIQGIFHSHPYDKNDKKVHENGRDPKWPSKADQLQWSQDTIPWAIVSTDGNGISKPVVMDENQPAPLLGREFIWGIQDCYSLVRDYYKQELGIVLSHYPRDWAWWWKGEDLFVDHFIDEGFRVIDIAKADIHDLCLFKRESKVINHIGIISGTNDLIQQGVHSLSKITRLDLFKKDVMICIRHASQEKPDVT